MPGLWLLSFAVPMFLTPYPLYVFADFLPALRCEAVPDRLGPLFPALVRPRDAFLAELVVAFGGAAVLEMEGQVRQASDGDVVDSFEEYALVELIDAKDLCDDFLQMVLAQAFAGMIFLVGAFPVGVPVTIGHDACLLPVVAAAFLAAYFRGEAGDVVPRDWMPPSVLRCALPVLICPGFLFGVPIPVVLQRGSVGEFEDHGSGFRNGDLLDSLGEDVLVKFQYAEHLGAFRFQDILADDAA